MILLLLPLKRVWSGDKLILIENIREKKQAQFIKGVKICQHARDEACIVSRVPARFYFPERDDFGCKSAEKDAGYITASEFSKCVSRSVPNEALSPPMNLRDALMRCFDDPAAKWQLNAYIETKYGYGCHIGLEGGVYRLTSVTPGC